MRLLPECISQVPTQVNHTLVKSPSRSVSHTKACLRGISELIIRVKLNSVKIDWHSRVLLRATWDNARYLIEERVIGRLFVN